MSASEIVVVGVGEKMSLWGLIQFWCCDGRMFRSLCKYIERGFLSVTWKPISFWKLKMMLKRRYFWSQDDVMKPNKAWLRRAFIEIAFYCRSQVKIVINAFSIHWSDECFRFVFCLLTKRIFVRGWSFLFVLRLRFTLKLNLRKISKQQKQNFQ